MAKSFQVDTGGTLLTGLMAYYDFQTDSKDQSVNGRDGVDTNAPTYTAGKVGNALTCVRASLQYVSVPNAVITWGTNVLSVNFWFKLAAINLLTSLAPMTARTGQGTLIYYDGTNLVFSKPNVADCYAAWAGENTNYHMLTCVGRSAATFMQIYLDGASFATNANSANWVDPLGDTLTIGGFKSAGAMQANWYLGGQIDELGFWSKSLSAQEIGDLYNNGVGQTMVEAGVKAVNIPTLLMMNVG